MIKYKTLYEKDCINHKYILDITKEIPVHVIWGNGNEEYAIPYKNKKSYYLHREDGPARIVNNNNGYTIIIYYWYETSAISKKEWLDLEWRRKIEIRKFL